MAETPPGAEPGHRPFASDESKEGPNAVGLVGVSPMQYAMHSRLTYARLLLQSTERSIADIARQCGWQDTSNFVRRFRRRFDCTPLQYRNGKRKPAGGGAP